MSDLYELAVIGGGIGGAAAALRAGQYNLRTAWILGDKKTARRSRSMWVRKIDNMIGVHPGVTLGLLRKQWRRRPELLEALDALPELEVGGRAILENVHARLTEFEGVVDEFSKVADDARRLEDGTFEIDLDGQDEPVRARAVVLSTGVMDRQPLVAKERRGALDDTPKWIYPFANEETVLYCIRCEGHLTRDKMVAILGSSETAAQVGLMLQERYGSTCCLLANGEPVTVSEQTRQLLDHYRITIHEPRIVDVVQEDGTRRARRASHASPPRSDRSCRTPRPPRGDHPRA